MTKTNQEKNIKVFESKEKEVYKELNQKTDEGAELLDKINQGTLTTDEWVEYSGKLYQNAIKQRDLENELKTYQEVLKVLKK